MIIHIVRRGVVCLLLLATVAARGTAEPAAAPSPLLRQVAPKPSGQNGYEELLAAADALRSSARYAAVDGKPATLDAKRRALRDPPVIRALELTRRGLSKPILQPRETVTFQTAFPELAAFRSLARLLALQQYVLLADGRVPEALDWVRLGLRFSSAIQTDTIISGLVGLACSSIVVRTVGGHLEQLSARDCERLHQICVEWLREPDPLPRVLDGERRFAKESFRATMNADGKELEAMMGPEPPPGEPVDAADSDNRRTVAEAKRLRATSRDKYAAMIADVEQQIDRYYAATIAEAREPAWERKPVPTPQGEGLAERMVAMIAPAVSSIGDRYTRTQAMVRLLACHAAIRRYRWEHDQLPPTLVALNLGDLAIDPFTGQALKYQIRGMRYTLTSIGPPAAEDDPNAVDGRRPVSVVPGE